MTDAEEHREACDLWFGTERPQPLDVDDDDRDDEQEEGHEHHD